MVSRITKTLAVSALALGAALPALAGDRALVVGIDSYPALGLERPLHHATSDAQRFHDFLIDHWDFAPSEITLLKDEAATSGAIMDTLIDRLVGETAPGDRVVFYFSGLGSRVAGRGSQEADGLTEVLLAYDAASLLGKMPEDAFADILDLIPDRDVTLVIDASNDGDMSFRAASADTVATRGVTLDGDRDPNGAKLRSGPAPLNAQSFLEAPFGAGNAPRDIWAASAPGQFAWESTQSGVFTDAFMNGIADGMADANGNGTITNAELLTFLRAQSEAWCGTTPDCAMTGMGLTPHFSGDVEEVMATVDASMTAPQTIPTTIELPETLAPTPVAPITGPSVTPETTGGYAEALGFVTDLFTPSNTANLTLSIPTGTEMALGDIVEFEAKADTPGTLVILDINPNGELAQVYPSALSQEGTTDMIAGQTLTIPNGLSTSGRPLQIRVSEPAGEGFLLALFIEDELPNLTALLPENIQGGPIPNAGQYLYEIAQDLLRMQATPTGNSAVEWSATYLPYRIAE